MYLSRNAKVEREKEGGGLTTRLRALYTKSVSVLDHAECHLAVFVLFDLPLVHHIRAPH